MKRILMSVSLMAFAGAIAFGATGAFFSDSEVSTGNTFTAGGISLQVDSTQHYNNAVCVLSDGHGTWQLAGNATAQPDQYPVIGSACTGTWTPTTLGPTNQFFNFGDIKPQDVGEDTISIHNVDNPAWICADLAVTSNIDGSGASSVVTSSNSDFEPTAYTLGNPNGQNGWTFTGPYDVTISSSTNALGFGTQSLRISDAVTSGSFGDWVFSPSVANEAGETAAVSNGLSGGTRQKHFEAQFDVASVLPTLQSGLHVSVSPDRGDGSRMSYLKFEDDSDGIHVLFDDVQGTSNPANFVETDIATITRAPHLIKFVMDFVDGPSNDIVKIYIDGVLVHTGTSWENYYRFDSEAAGSGNQVPTVDSLIFQSRTGSGPVTNPADQGEGLLFDNVLLSSGQSSAGSLASEIQFATWVDNASTSGAVPGDNIHQASEPLTFGPAPLGATGTTTLPLADSTHGTPFAGTSVGYVGIAWCAGTMTVDPTTGAISCNGASMGNEAQHDSMTANVTLRAEQSRNQPNFSCGEAPVTPAPTNE